MPTATQTKETQNHSSVNECQQQHRRRKHKTISASTNANSNTAEGNAKPFQRQRMPTATLRKETQNKSNVNADFEFSFAWYFPSTCSRPSWHSAHYVSSIETSKARTNAETVPGNLLTIFAWFTLPYLCMLVLVRCQVSVPVCKAELSQNWLVMPRFHPASPRRVFVPF